MKFQTVGASGEWVDKPLGEIYDGFVRLSESSVSAVRIAGQKWLDKFHGEILPQLSAQWKAATGRDLDEATWRAIPARIFDSGSVWDQVVATFNKVNPVMIGARAAFLSLTRSNYQGLAVKMGRDVPKAVRVWERFGGDGGTLRAAITTGQGRVGVLPAFLVPAVVDAAAGAGSGGGGDREGGGGFLSAAKPILDAILALFGLGDENVDDQGDANVVDSGQGGDQGGGQGNPPDKAERQAAVLPLVIIGGAALLLAGNR